MQPTVEDARLKPILEKVQAGERLSYDDGLALYRTFDLLAVGYMANLVRERMHGNRDLLQRQPPHQSHRRVRGELQAVRLRQACARSQGVHHVARRGVAPRRRRLERSHHGVPHRRRAAPRTDPRLVLRDAARTQAALSAGPSEGVHHGRDRLPGAADEDQHCAKLSSGCAMPAWIRCPAGAPKFSATACAASSATTRSTASEWLEIARTAHRMGLRSNCTMLYGHIENEEDRVDHLLELRALQDETGGFVTFIPLAFHPDNTPLRAYPARPPASWTSRTSRWRA